MLNAARVPGSLPGTETGGLVPCLTLTNPEENCMIARKCKKCERDRPHSDFRANKRSRDGLARNCNNCVAQIHQHRQDRKPRTSKYTAEERKRRRQQSLKKYYEKNKLSIQIVSEAWRRRNSEKLTASAAKRRAVKKQQSPSLTEHQKLWMAAIYRRAQRMTQVTGITYHVDHWWPISRGGLHVPWNLYVIPAKDNLEKGRRRPGR